MKNSKILIIGILIGVVVWGLAFAAFFSGSEKDDVARGAQKTEQVADSISEEEHLEPPAAVPAKNTDLPRGESVSVSGPVAGTSVSQEPPRRAAKIPAPPRKAMSSFQCAGEICVDATTGRVLAGTNTRVKCAPASVVKLMTLYVVLDAVASGRLKLDDTTIASKRAQDMGGTQLYLATGEPCVVNDLIYALMVESANDAAVALAEKLCGSVEDFVDLMNKEAKGLGMTNSSFSSPHGLPLTRKERAAGKRGDMTTAEDLARLSVALLQRFPGVLEYTSTKTYEYPANSVRKKPLGMKNHNKLLALFSGCDGMKTGWTNSGASIVTTASRGNARVVAVVLCGLVKNKRGEIDSKSSQTERNQRAACLMYDGFKKLDVLKYEPTPFKR